MKIQKLVAGLVMAFISAPVFGQAIELTISDSSGMEGDTISVPIVSDQPFDGLDILSYQLHLTYNQNSLEVISVTTSGSASESFGSVLGNEASPGNYYIAAAGTNPLSGEKPLIYLDVVLKQSGNQNFNFGAEENNFFNEGEPEMVTEGGRISVDDLPVISVSPVNVTLARGEQQQFNAGSSAEPPVSWSVSDEDVAGITDDGLLTAVGYGEITVTATDERGLSATTNPITVHALSISSQGVEQFQGLPAAITIDVSTLDGLDVISGSFSITHSAIGNTVLSVSADKEGMLLENADVNLNFSGNTLYVAFASADVIEGEGELLSLVFETRDDQTTSTNLQFTDVVFNDALTAQTTSFLYRIQAPPSLSVSSSTNSILAGDEIQLSVSNAQGNVIWNVDNPGLGEIDEDGLFTGTNGGQTTVSVTDSIGASGTSSPITIYDFALAVESSGVLAGEEAMIPVSIENSDNSDIEILSFEGLVDLRGLLNDPVPVTEGTGMENWSVSSSTEGDNIRVALAGAEPVPEDGILFYIKGEVSSETSAQNTQIRLLEAVINDGSPHLQLSNGTLSVTDELDVPQLSAPDNNAADTDTSVTFVWNDVTGASMYTFRLSENEDFEHGSYVEIDVTETELTVDSLQTITNYYWQVRAEAASGLQSDWSSTFVFTTRVPVPDVVTLTSPGNNVEDVSLQPHFTWESIEFAEEYQLQLTSAEDFQSVDMDIVIDGDVEWVPETELEAETGYRWRVRGINTSGDGQWSEEWTFATGEEVPPVPEAVVLISPEDQKEQVAVIAGFEWQAADGAGSYQFQLSGEVSFTQLIADSSDIEQTMFEMTDSLEHLTSYFWRVRAVNEGGAGEWSEVWTFTTVMDVPDAVALISPEDGAAGQSLKPGLTWEEAGNAEAYQVHISMNDAFTTLHTDSTISELTTMTPAVPLDYESGYFWRVRALNDGGAGEWSEVWTFTTQMAIPGKVSLLNPSDHATDVSLSPELEWDGTEGVESYQLQIATDEPFENLVVNLSEHETEEYIHEEELNATTLYFWRVRAVNESGEGEWSDVFRFTTQSVTGIDGHDVPEAFALDQNYPNPFNPVTQIRYSVPEQAHVRLEVYNALGQRVVTLVNESKSPGRYEATFDASGLSSGLYLYRFQSASFTESRQMLLLK